MVESKSISRQERRIALQPRRPPLMGPVALSLQCPQLSLSWNRFSEAIRRTLKTHFLPTVSKLGAARFVTTLRRHHRASSPMAMKLLFFELLERGLFFRTAS